MRLFTMPNFFGWIWIIVFASGALTLMLLPRLTRRFDRYLYASFMFLAIGKGGLLAYNSQQPIAGLLCMSFGVLCAFVGFWRTRVRAK